MAGSGGLGQEGSMEETSWMMGVGCEEWLEPSDYYYKVSCIPLWHFLLQSQDGKCFNKQIENLVYISHDIILSYILATST